MKKYLLPMFLLVFGSVAEAQKQDSTVVRDVTIEREYNPVIMDSKKIQQTLPIIEVKQKQSAIKYSLFSNPLQITSPPAILQQAPLTAMSRDSYKKGFAKLALGIPLKWEATLGYPLLLTRSTRLNLIANNQGLICGKDKEIKTGNTIANTQQKNIETNIGLQFAHYINNSVVYANASFRNRLFNYYGIGNILDTCKYLIDSTAVNGESLRRNIKQLNNLNFQVGYRSQPMNEVKYDVQLDYKIFGAPAGFLENMFSANTLIDAPMGNNSWIFDINVHGLWYGKSKGYVNPLPPSACIIDFHPSFNVKTERLRLKIGLKSFFSINRGQVANITPNVNIEYLINPKIATIYLNIDGNYKTNTFSDLYDINRFFGDNQSKPTYTPLDVNGGIQIKPFRHFFVNVFADYQIIQDMYFFTNSIYKQITNPTTAANAWTTENRYSNIFSATYSNAQLLTVGLHADYNFKDKFNIYFKGNYNHWYVKNENKAWHHPEWEMNIGGDVNITSDIRFSAGYYLGAVRYAKLADGQAVSLKNIHDINFSFSYSYSSWLSVFLKADNILGLSPKNRYQYWYGYNVLGSIMAGVIFSF